MINYNNEGKVLDNNKLDQESIKFFNDYKDIIKVHGNLQDFASRMLGDFNNYKYSEHELKIIFAKFLELISIDYFIDGVENVSI
jgi:hypothetical protein